jgi:hypothetical protein
VANSRALKSNESLSALTTHQSHFSCRLRLKQ